MNRKCLILVAGGAALLTACPPRAKSSRSEAPAPVPKAGLVANAVQPVIPVPQGPPPEIFFAESEFNAGTIKQGEVVEHTFVVKNRGLGALNIEKVKGS